LSGGGGDGANNTDALGNALGFASGSNGRISGPGTTTSDSILAWLSNREVVLQAAAADALESRFGSGIFHLLNNFHKLGKNFPGFSGGGMVDRVVRTLVVPQFPFPRFAGGTNAPIAIPSMASARGQALHPVTINLGNLNGPGVGRRYDGLLAPASVVEALKSAAVAPYRRDSRRRWLGCRL